MRSPATVTSDSDYPSIASLSMPEIGADDQSMAKGSQMSKPAVPERARFREVLGIAEFPRAAGRASRSPGSGISWPAVSPVALLGPLRQDLLGAELTRWCMP